ncbi:conserved hypothetical protein, partial [Ricinus communis]
MSKASHTPLSYRIKGQPQISQTLKRNSLFFPKLSIELFARSSLSSQVSSLSGTIPSEWINRVILILAYQGADLSYLIDPGENRANLIAPSQYQQTKRRRMLPFGTSPCPFGLINYFSI